MYLLVTELLSGLALFLFGMKYMSDSLQQAAGGKLRGVCAVSRIAVLFHYLQHLYSHPEPQRLWKWDSLMQAL